MDADKVKALPVQSKRYITKVMFLCAVAKPIYDDYEREANDIAVCRGPI